MSWKVFGEVLETSDFSGTIPRMYQPVVMNKKYAVKAVRTWVVIYGDPVFTTMQMLICSSKRVIHTFEKSWTLNEITGLDYAAREIYFDFEKPISLDDAITYNFALKLNGYTGTADSHVSWIRGFPDKSDDNSVVLDYKNLGVMPFWMRFVASDL